MNFVSIPFALFFAAVLALLLVIRAPLLRKLILLAASGFFYAWWNWRFLGLLAASAVLNYGVSRLLVRGSAPAKRKALLFASLLANLGLLGFFKYFNFFLGPLNALLGTWGWKIGALNIILPIGISFFTFKNIGYAIDVYHERIRPARSLLDFAVFITFFPSLVSGPIVRAQAFLPQLERGARILPSDLLEGLQLFLRGLLKKLVIADNLAVMVNAVYKSPSLLSSPTVWLGVFAYSVQILCDFSGYTDMARGLGKMLGFELPQNFDLPYAARSVAEFWRRWHMTLSSWFRDYVFLPLAYAVSRRLRRQRYFIFKVESLIYFASSMITFLLVGLWHGASWLFVVWGGLQGAYLVIERAVFRGKQPKDPRSSAAAAARSLLVFGLISVAWVPFRAPDGATALAILKKMLFIGAPYHFAWYYVWALAVVPAVVVGGLLVRRNGWKWPMIPARKSYLPAFLLGEILTVFFFAPLNSNPFIYFRF